MKDKNINNDEAKKIFKILEYMEGSKIDYSKLVYRSGDNQYFDFNWFGTFSSIYLKLINGNIGINVAKLNIEDFRDEIDRLERTKAKKELYKRNKKEVLENAKALCDGVKIIIDAFERGVIKYGDLLWIDINYDSETYGLTNKEMQMFRKRYSYGKPNKLWNVLMDADEEKYTMLLNDLQIKQKVLDEQSDTKTGIERERLVNVVNTVEGFWGSVKGYKSMHDSKTADLTSEESATEGKSLKILTPSQMLSKLPISLTD